MIFFPGNIYFQKVYVAGIVLYSEFLKKVSRSCLFLQPWISKSAKLLDLQLILIGPLF